jgi:hypothetical protein
MEYSHLNFQAEIDQAEKEEVNTHLESVNQEEEEKMKSSASGKKEKKGS